MTKNEALILAVVRHLDRKSVSGHTGFQIARSLQCMTHARFLVGLSTLYNALYSLVEQDLLARRLEELPPETKRPRRCFYYLTPEACLLYPDLSSRQFPKLRR